MTGPKPHEEVRDEQSLALGGDEVAELVTHHHCDDENDNEWKCPTADPGEQRHGRDDPHEQREWRLAE